MDYVALMEHVLATLAGSTMPMGRHVLGVRQTSF
jgi:hypothetical protein